MQGKYDHILDELRTKLLKWYEINEVNQWVLFSNKEGYVVYTRPHPEIGLNISRVQTEIAFRVDDVANVASDVKKRQFYDEKVETAHVIEELDAYTKVIYVRVKPPAFLMSSRDLVLVQRIYRNQDGSVMILSRSIVHEKAPPIHKIERAEMYLSAWILTPTPRGVNIIALQCLDPRGDIPKAIVNEAAKFQTDMVKSLVKYVANAR